MCTRCVRFTREIAGTCELMVDGRGHREEIDIFPGKPVTNSISLNVIDICPVGALLDKQFLFKQRVWLLKRAPSISPCDAGGENIWIEHNEGVVHRITPRYNAEVNKWWISDETRHACQALTDSRRLLHPRVKQHGAQGASGWPAALEAADRGMVSLVHQHGQGSLCAVLSPMSSCEEAWLLGRYIRGLDRNALLVVGPVPATQDEVFKHYVTGRETFRIQGEKVPNRRGVERVIALLGGPNARWEDLLSGTRDDVKRLRGAWVVGGYLSNWVGGDLPALLGRGFVVLQDVLETVLAERCDVVLPAAMWAEKSGCWENHQGKLQAFAAAIDPPAGVDRECDVYYRLLQKTESCEVAELRRAMGEPFTSVSLPREAAPTEPAFDFVEL
jgi:NADH-quinone oxidoreductase subunit G